MGCVQYVIRDQLPNALAANGLQAFRLEIGETLFESGEDIVDA